jgi:hypothetical protein
LGTHYGLTSQCSVNNLRQKWTVKAETDSFSEIYINDISGLQEAALLTRSRSLKLLAGLQCNEKEDLPKSQTAKTYAALREQ